MNWMSGWDRSHLVDVLALEPGNEGVEAVAVSLDADGLEDGSDVLGRGAGVASEAEEEVSGEVLHFVCSVPKLWLDKLLKCAAGNFCVDRRIGTHE